MDIKQSPTARAAITLGKDMTMRDFAQGAWRMRGLAQGQTLQILVIGEVQELITQVIKPKSISGDSLVNAIEPRQRWDDSCYGKESDHERRRRQQLLDICAWLLSGSMSRAAATYAAAVKC